MFCLIKQKEVCYATPPLQNQNQFTRMQSLKLFLASIPTDSFRREMLSIILTTQSNRKNNLLLDYITSNLAVLMEKTSSDGIHIYTQKGFFVSLWHFERTGTVLLAMLCQTAIHRQPHALKTNTKLSTTSIPGSPFVFLCASGMTIAVWQSLPSAPGEVSGNR